MDESTSIALVPTGARRPHVARLWAGAVPGLSADEKGGVVMDAYLHEYKDSRIAALERENAELRAALEAARQALVAGNEALERIHDDWAEPSASASMGQSAAIAFAASIEIDGALLALDAAREADRG